jgi:hypothetical protein
MRLIEKRADAVGQHGRAWLLRAPTDDVPELGAWFLYAPGWTPISDWYLASLIHLRPVDGLPEPKLMAPGVTHELVVATLRQDVADLDFGGGERYPMSVPVLYPVNAVAQGRFGSDADASTRVASLVDRVLAGSLCPEEEGRKEWRTLFSEEGFNGRAN